MKRLLLLSITLVILLAIAGCEKDPPEAMLPDEVELGESVVYLNGKEVDYLPFLEFDTVNKVMNYVFAQSRNQGQLINSLGFGRLPYNTGEFELTTENILYVKARTSFHQTVDEDVEGYEYELTDADEGFINVEYLDTVKMEVKGRFKAKFCRTSKNGNKDLGLPKNIVLQGVFYENYIFQ